MESVLPHHKNPHFPAVVSNSAASVKYIYRGLKISISETCSITAVQRRWKCFICENDKLRAQIFKQPCPETQTYIYILQAACSNGGCDSLSILVFRFLWPSHHSYQIVPPVTVVSTLSADQYFLHELHLLISCDETSSACSAKNFRPQSASNLCQPLLVF